MNTLQHQFIKGLPLIISYCFCCNSFLHAATSKLESDSPFLPPGYSKIKQLPPKPTRQPKSPLAKELEFRGVVQLNGIYHFSLFKKSENKGYWISENGSENGIGVSDFDSDSMEITVTVNGRSEKLALMAASEDPLPVVAKPSLPTPAMTPPNLPTNVQPRNNTNNKTPTRRRTIPRRRVIVPNKK